MRIKGILRFIEEVLMFCTYCGAKLWGDSLFCPMCGKKCLPVSENIAEKTVISEEHSEHSVIYCCNCGRSQYSESLYCTQCGMSIRGNVPQFCAQKSSWIPTRNPDAILAYYLGILSLLPFLGIIPVFFAVKYAEKALKKVKENPDIRGKKHAITGVIFCGISMLYNGVFAFCLLLSPLVYFLKK